MELELRPGDTIWHAAARLHGQWPQHWRYLAALNGVLDPFQVYDRDDQRPLLGGARLNRMRALRVWYDYGR